MKNHRKRIYSEKLLMYREKQSTKGFFCSRCKEHRLRTSKDVQSGLCSCCRYDTYLILKVLRGFNAGRTSAGVEYD